MMPENPQVSQLLHDLAGSITALDLCLFELERNPEKTELISLCQTAVEQARGIVHQLQHVSPSE
jgi:hypothetical protein